VVYALDRVTNATTLPPDLDTVAVAVSDLAGRLIGKRLTMGAWQAVVREGMFTMPDFHLVTDGDNQPIAKLEVTGAHTGFPNGVLKPDLDTLRPLPWHERSAIVLCDACHADGTPAEMAPRWILRRQVERLAELGLRAACASELEFYAYRTSFAAASRSGYRRLRPAYHRAADNDLLVDAHLEPLLGDIRRLMPLAGIPVELSQGEGGRGQFEVSLHHGDPLETADRHAVYKLGVKTLAERHGLAVTFMAKVADAEPGSSCHVHLSLADARGCALTAPGGALTPLGRRFVAGLLAFAPDLALLYAPNANSYKRLQPNTWAPANLTWGVDNRTTLVRVCGPSDHRRLEFRAPGADANPYLALAATLAAGIAGIERGLEPPPPCSGDAYTVDAPPLPRDLTEAVDCFAASAVARAALGDAVHEHVAGHGRHTLDQARREVTDRERSRWFEVA
jgi:glutamine synthetase